MDLYAYWQQELVEPGSLRRDTDRRDLCGFYRCHKVKTKPDYPVAIWMEGDTLHLQIGRSRPITERSDTEAFHRFFSTNWFHAKAVTEEVYRSVMGGAGFWPDGKEAWKHIDQLIPLDPDYLPTTPASEGGNAPEGGDAFEAIKADIERNINKVEAIGAIQTVEQAQAYTLLRDILNALHKRADAARIEEKRPHDEAANAVQAKWKPVVDAAKKFANFARDTTESWQREQDRQARIKAEEERRRVEAENERRANEHAEMVRLKEREAEAKADEGAFLPEPEPVPEPEFVPTPAAPAPVRVAGSPFGTARKARVIVTGEITDLKAFVDFLVAQKDQGLMEYLQGRANAAAKAKLSLPGVVRKEI